MVSEDTLAGTAEMLMENENFGLSIQLLKQEKVASISDTSCKLAMSDAYTIDTKPHGHGDVHALLHSTGTASNWLAKGVKWVFFFQDTNGLAFHTLPAMLGVSKKLELEVNSLAIPRYAKQAVGAIAKLVHRDGREMTVNVEYNQLDPLLKATIAPEGDVNDPVTGKSIFPGNINQLVFALEPYVENLKRTEGVMSEFVNPKFADSSRASFKKPTRLECMMQDYPKALSSTAKVGFTMAPAWLCYSPCKNNATDAAASVAAGVPAGSAWTAESDQYYAKAQMLRLLGCNIVSAPPVTFCGISAHQGPRIVIDPMTALFPGELTSLFPFPKNVSISPTSVLTIEGDVIIESLNLDGALILCAEPGTRIIVKAGGEDRQIVNAGHILEPIADGTVYPEVDRMRGFTISRIEEEIVVSKPKDESSPSSTSPLQEAENLHNRVDIFVYTGKALIEFEFYEDPSESSLLECCNALVSPFSSSP